MRWLFRWIRLYEGRCSAGGRSTSTQRTQKLTYSRSHRATALGSGRLTALTTPWTPLVKVNVAAGRLGSRSGVGRRLGPRRGRRPRASVRSLAIGGAGRARLLASKSRNSLAKEKLAVGLSSVEGDSTCIARYAFT